MASSTSTTGWAPRPSRREPTISRMRYLYVTSAWSSPDRCSQSCIAAALPPSWQSPDAWRLAPPAAWPGPASEPAWRSPSSCPSRPTCRSMHSPSRSHHGAIWRAIGSPSAASAVSPSGVWPGESWSEPPERSCAVRVGVRPSQRVYFVASFRILPKTNPRILGSTQPVTICSRPRGVCSWKIERRSSGGTSPLREACSPACGLSSPRSSISYWPRTCPPPNGDERRHRSSRASPCAPTKRSRAV